MSRRSALNRVVGGLASVLAAWLIVPAAAAAAPAPNTAPVSDTQVATLQAAALPASYRVDISMQAQQQTNWCWAAAGNTIAAWHGVSITQNNFCALAKNRSTSANCPNDQAHLGEVQNALRKLNFTNPGSYLSNTLTYATIQQQVAADQPIETRIGWSSGGGHMHVLYGYDTTKNWVYWGDPWGSSSRYNWGTYAFYRSNSQFTWTHTLTGIRR
ncbi:hypothetical protein JOF53_003445 [Crossiella equi]|uniref:Papain-like cysteine protease AvrRpt2 n=1 Tax=Crossiella equi TaxID=130796 RepID=A0ABS5ADC4_9PSEU|nr:papain-like cysteine protease family protein [Crossiella equi]MBP2474573.1 hypothetical protein [Crossiella equi]